MGRRAGFRLQPVLELRRTQERAAAQAAAQAANAAADADRHATERENALVGARPPGSAQAGVFRASMALLRVAAEDASAQRSLATASAEQAELVRQQWTAAAQKTKALERLKDRHAEGIRLADQAAEERAVDDLVTGRAGRPRTEEVPWTE